MIKKKRASEIFAAVDPHLKVVNGGTRRKHKSNWDASGGAFCPKCGEEAVRFRPQDGICRRCADAQNEKEVRNGEKRAKQLRQMKAHNARISRRGTH